MDVIRIHDNEETVDMFSAFKPLLRNNLNALFEEITVSLNK